jgi:hypothetical protein
LTGAGPVTGPRLISALTEASNPLALPRRHPDANVRLAALRMTDPVEPAPVMSRGSNASSALGCIPWAGRP